MYSILPVRRFLFIVGFALMLGNSTELLGQTKSISFLPERYTYRINSEMNDTLYLDRANFNELRKHFGNNGRKELCSLDSILFEKAKVGPGHKRPWYDLLFTENGTHYFGLESSKDSIFQVQIIITERPEIEKAVICKDGDSVLVYPGNGLFEINWEDKKSLNSHWFLNTGIYTYRYSNSICSGSGMAYITQPRILNNLPSDTTICSRSFWIPPMPKMMWDSVLWDNKDRLPAFNQSKQYTRSVYKDGCKFDHEMAVTVVNSMAPTVIDTAICEGEILQFTLPDQQKLMVNKLGLNYKYWFNGCDSVLFAVSAKAADACDCKVWIPGVFTPNKDGVNDVFEVISNCTVQNQHMVVFNRWGQKVYNADNWSWRPQDLFADKYVVVVSGVILHRGKPEPFTRRQEVIVFK